MSLAGINLTKSIITLNGVGLNTPNKRQIFKRILAIYISQSPKAKENRSKNKQMGPN